jgi:hypothetical protein
VHKRLQGVFLEYGECLIDHLWCPFSVYFSTLKHLCHLCVCLTFGSERRSILWIQWWCHGDVGDFSALQQDCVLVALQTNKEVFHSVFSNAVEMPEVGQPVSSQKMAWS